MAGRVSLEDRDREGSAPWCGLPGFTFYVAVVVFVVHKESALKQLTGLTGSQGTSYYFVLSSGMIVV